MAMGDKIYTGMDAFMEGASASQKMWDSMVMNRLNKAKAAEQEAKNPYVGQQSAADLQNQQNINKWYGPKAQSEISLQGANAGLANQQSKWYGPKSEAEIGLQNSNAALNRQEHDYPGLRGTELTKEAAIVDILSKTHPELIKQAHDQVAGSQGQTNQPDQTGQQQPTPQGQMQAPNAPPAQPQYNQLDAIKQHIQARIAEKQVNAAYKNSGMSGGRGAVDVQKQKQLQSNVARDNPGFTEDQQFEAAGKLLNGDEKLDDGTPINHSGLTDQAVLGVQGAKATASIKNQAADLDVAVNELDSFPIEDVSDFAGPQGKAKLMGARLKMVTNPNDPSIDPKARNVISAINTSIQSMDRLRKAYGTSIVPEYVYKTMGKLANPSDSIWNDKTQVMKTYKDMVNIVRKNRDDYMAKVRKGVTASTNNSSVKTRKYNLDTGSFE